MAKIIDFPKRNKVIPFPSSVERKEVHISCELATDRTVKKIWNLRSKEFFNMISNKPMPSKNEDG